jgi:hypothetical protein
MAVRTTADDAVTKVSDGLNLAIEGLREIIIDRVYGHDNFNGSFRSDLTTTLITLLEVRDNLFPV